MGVYGLAGWLEGVGVGWLGGVGVGWLVGGVGFGSCSNQKLVSGLVGG